MMIVIIFVACVLIGMALIAVSNAVLFPRLRKASMPEHAPCVSVLIPARNEAAIIGRTVRGLLAQTYTQLEIIILDDHSEDETAAVAWQAAAGDMRVRVIEGQPLPAGWLGKNWACHQLAQAATSDILIFADADVIWSSGAIAGVAETLHTSGADLVTVWPTQLTRTWGERLVVPLVALAIIGYLPVVGVHFTSGAWFAAACGQCLIFRRRVYEQIGGHTAVYDNIIEDVALARRVKQNGLRLRMVDGAGTIGCRMYTDWGSVRKGFAKNILAGHGNSVVLLAISTVFHWAVFVLPWVWLTIGGGVWPLALVTLGVGVRALSAALTGQRVQDALWMPVSVLLMTVIAAQSVWWHWHGGPQWKGRVIAQDHSQQERLQMADHQRKYPVSSHQVGVER